MVMAVPSVVFLSFEEIEYNSCTTGLNATEHDRDQQYTKSCLHPSQTSQFQGL